MIQSKVAKRINALKGRELGEGKTIRLAEGRKGGEREGGVIA